LGVPNNAYELRLRRHKERKLPAFSAMMPDIVTEKEAAI
jgi:hypothetical protein